MPNYMSPGIYIEEPPSGPRPIQGVSTSVAAFIGNTPTGGEKDRLGNVTREFTHPRLVTSWEQFCREFGKRMKDGSYDPYEADSYMAYSVYGFFENGGTRCYIVRTNRTGQAAGTFSHVAVKALNNGGGDLFEVSVPKELKDAKLLVDKPKQPPTEKTDKPATAQADKADKGAKAGPDAQQAGDGAAADATAEKITFPEDVFYVELQVGGTKLPLGNVSFGPESDKYKGVAQAFRELRTSTEARQAGLSGLQFEFVADDADLLPVSDPKAIPFEQRSMELANIRGDSTLKTGTQGLQLAEEVAIVCCPDLMAYYDRAKKAADADEVKIKKLVKATQQMLTTHCEQMSNRMVILDSLPDLDAQGMQEWQQELGIESAYAALYYPWIEVMKHDTSGKPETIKVPPCGHVAGVWARTDAERGVHKAPANESLRGAIEPTVKITRNEQDGLNPVGVNCIRTFPGRGTLVYGARTMAAVAKAEWRYINVRRLFNYVEKSLEEGMQWVVFEPNNQD